MASSLSDDALAGAFSGFVGRIITAPFDVVKIRQQLLYNSIPIMRNPLMTMSSTFKQVIQEEGILALWKGNLSATILWVSYSAFQFGVYGFLKEIDAHLTPIDRRNDAFTKLCRMVFAGGVSGE
jgi:solute carrier family 25 thiamine pyrophosphate transporter 19